MKTLKHLFTALLLMVATVATAHDFEVDGICYNILSEEKKTVEVTFRGVFIDSYSSKYRGRVDIPSSVISNGITYAVTSIGYEAFYDCSGLTSITIPNSVTSIGESAFRGCTGLTSITIPSSVTTIGNYAFYYCTGLTNIVVDEGNSVYDSRDNCNAIIITATNRLIAGCRNTVIPGSVTTIGDGAFYYCTELTSIEIPNSVTSIGGEAFRGCTGLTSITIPNSVTNIGNHAFYECTGLTSITIPNSVTNIGIYAFYGCTRLTTVVNFSNLTFTKGSSDYGFIAYYANEVINIPSSSIEGDFGFSIKDGINTLLYYWGNATELILPVDYKGENYVIGDNVFKNYTTLTSVTIPNSITSIGNSAFFGCTGLTRVDIVDGVKSIGYSAFAGCSNLEELYISNTIESIADCAFKDCTNILEIKVGSKKAITCNENIFSEDVYNNALLYIPEGRKFAYEKTVPWNRFYIVEADFTDISGVKEQIAESKTVYDLQGRKVDNPTNGIYIVNGKKAFLK